MRQVVALRHLDEAFGFERLTEKHSLLSGEKDGNITTIRSLNRRETVERFPLLLPLQHRAKARCE